MSEGRAYSLSLGAVLLVVATFIDEETWRDGAPAPSGAIESRCEYGSANKDSRMTRSKACWHSLRRNNKQIFHQCLPITTVGLADWLAVSRETFEPAGVDQRPQRVLNATVERYQSKVIF